MLAQRDEQLAEELAQTPEETVVTETAEMADDESEEAVESDEMADDEPEDDADDEEQ